MPKMKTIISASRRTDLPKFHYQWLQGVLATGEVQISNPRFREKVYKVDLRPECVHSIVLWSKDYTNVLKDPGYLENYNVYFQYTINNYSKALEPNVPPYGESIRILEGLLKRYMPSQFNIRFDPIVFCRMGERSRIIPPDVARLSAFELLCKDLKSLGMTECRITTSYIAMYPHVMRKIGEAGIKIENYNENQMVIFFERLSEIAKTNGLQLYCCASPLLEKVDGMTKGSCIDGKLLESLFGGKVSKASDTGQRKTCGCYKSSDIGDYQKKCSFNCVYCYSKSD